MFHYDTYALERLRVQGRSYGATQKHPGLPRDNQGHRETTRATERQPWPPRDYQGYRETTRAAERLSELPRYNQGHRETIRATERQPGPPRDYQGYRETTRATYRSPKDKEGPPRDNQVHQKTKRAHPETTRATKRQREPPEKTRAIDMWFKGHSNGESNSLLKPTGRNSMKGTLCLLAVHSIGGNLPWTAAALLVEGDSSLDNSVFDDTGYNNTGNNNTVVQGRIYRKKCKLRNEEVNKTSRQYRIKVSQKREKVKRRVVEKNIRACMKTKECQDLFVTLTTEIKELCLCVIAKNPAIIGKQIWHIWEIDGHDITFEGIITGYTKNEVIVTYKEKFDETFITL
ncbi:hypothetical protein Btru_059844 [Bulinus truncatus]|nr:hypothetical protein Btru_059844 [Bulinus truncatus]